jgi:hypothetical protein
LGPIFGNIVACKKALRRRKEMGWAELERVLKEALIDDSERQEEEMDTLRFNWQGYDLPQMADEWDLPAENHS